MLRFTLTAPDEGSLNPGLGLRLYSSPAATLAAVRLAALALCAALTSCTPGALGATSGGGTTASLVVDVNLTNHGPAGTPAGTGGGYAPLVATVAVGSTIRFINSDGFAHTATAIPGATKFPSGFPFTLTALQQSGATLSGGFSSGDMQAGASSQQLLADRSGTYLFGCFHHYGAPMRGMIVVQ